MAFCCATHAGGAPGPILTALYEVVDNNNNRVYPSTTNLEESGAVNHLLEINSWRGTFTTNLFLQSLRHAVTCSPCVALPLPGRLILPHQAGQGGFWSRGRRFSWHIQNSRLGWDRNGREEHDCYFWSGRYGHRVITCPGWCWLFRCGPGHRLLYLV